ncbi:MAG: hypothetical protein Q9195_006674 [Heterodermia aff. obscurata]
MRIHRAPILFRARTLEDPDCMLHDGPSSIFQIESDSDSDIVRVLLDKHRNFPWGPKHKASSASRTQPRKRQRSDDADEDGADASKTISPGATAPTEIPKDSPTETETAAAQPSGMFLNPLLGKDWGVKRRIMAEAERRSEGSPKPDAA